MSTSSEITKRAIKTDRSRLLHFLGLFEGRDRALIVINLDPDSMAGAMAVKRLLWKRVNKISIAHIGEIQRLDNLAMITLLKIPLIRLDKIDREAFTRRILVDSHPDHSEILEQMSYDVIIDHHPQTKKWNVPDVDIRLEYGATSTMLIEYLRRAKVKLSVRYADP